MEIKQLRAFLAVANAKSFLAAAETMYITRQAVSKTVTQLEEELGVKLFVRGQSGAELTPAGAYFYPQARTLVADFDRLQREMTQLEQSTRPKLRICMAVGVNTIFTGRILRYATEHAAEMELQLTSCRDADCDYVLSNYRADMVLSFSPLNAKNTVTSVILESPIVFLVNNTNPLSRENVVELSWRHRVANFLLYTGGRDHCLWWPVIPRQGDTCCNDLDYLYQLLREDRGILPLPRDMLPEDLSYAMVMQGRPSVEPCRIYCSTLRPSFYDPATYKLLERVSNEVLPGKTAEVSIAKGRLLLIKDY